ncbi:MAG: adenylate kinase [Candidatus Bathyarchaeota archaeon]|nr:adenylate kinase [Candidatus Bathyarchaeota archaeon]
MGPPGSGKGTRARIIGKMFDVPVITAGDMLRDAVSKGTELGLVIKRYMNLGELVPDDIVIATVEERLSMPDVEKGFVLDGFPRNINQAIALDRTLKRLDAKVDYVVTVAARPETIAARVSFRRICSKCGAVYHLKDIVPKVEGICDECGGTLIQREDDKEEIIRRRFEVYEMQTFPIIERYSTVGNLREISGELEIEEIPSVLEKLLSPRD